MNLSLAVYPLHTSIDRSPVRRTVHSTFTISTLIAAPFSSNTTRPGGRNLQHGMFTRAKNEAALKNNNVKHPTPRPDQVDAA